MLKTCKIKIGHNDFELFFDKMEPPRPEIDAKWNYMTAFFKKFNMCTVS
jgi:hypothetical protein